jgi:hypothetical protein
MVQAAFNTTMNPGMIVRLEQSSINSVKRAMEEFLPHYINVDLDLPKTYHYEFGLFFNLLQWKITWTDIEWSNVDLDIADVKIQLTRSFDKALMSVKFPAVKHWEIDAKQDVNFWFLPDYSNIQLIFKDFKIDFETDLVLDEHGYLDPVVYSADIHFGESYLYHDNPITAFVMHQFIYFGIVIIENSVYFVGQYIFTNMMGPVMDSFLNHYMFPFAFPSMIRGQNTWDLFTLDFRNTQSPYIGDGWIDFFIHGQVLYAGQGCNIVADNLEFSVTGSTMSQVVISESAATCIANNVAKSHLGHITLNSQTVKDLWYDPKVTNFTTSSLGKHFPILQKKLGKNKPLHGYVTFKDFNVIFGSFDTDVIASYTTCFALYSDDTGKELIYDELKMVTSAKVKSDNDKVYISLLKNKLFIDNQYGQSTEPMRNSMKLTSNEYREFISSFGFFQNYLKKWFNNVYFKNGINFPYNPQELYTSLEFQEKQLHVMIEVEGEIAEFLEDELWDKDALNQRDKQREALGKI